MRKKIFCVLAVAIGLGANGFSQGFLDKIKNKASDAGSDLIAKKATQKAEKVIDGDVRKKDESKSSNNDVYEEKHSMTQSGGGLDRIESYSKFDFVAGENILFNENFEQDVIGEFPLKWFTNGSAEVVSLKGYEGKWLKLVTGRILTPTIQLPENFILEYDLVLDMPFDIYANTISPFPNWEFKIFDGGDRNLKLANPSQNNTLSLKTVFYQNYAEIKLHGMQNKITKVNTNMYPSHLTGFNRNYNGGLVHIAMTIQGERFRVWYNEEKVLDIPSAVAIKHNFNQIEFVGMKRDGKPAFYIGNIRLSEGKADTRSKLMEEGRLVTTAIQFDSGSDVIRPVSYGILKEIADSIKESGIQVKIIGHTDNVGGKETNLNLSKRRAEAVKKILVTNFDLDPTKIQTAGEGPNKPIGDNSTGIGKAQNRRVEFVKL